MQLLIVTNKQHEYYNIKIVTIYLRHPTINFDFTKKKSSFGAIAVFPFYNFKGQLFGQLIVNALSIIQILTKKKYSDCYSAYGNNYGILNTHGN